VAEPQVRLDPPALSWGEPKRVRECTFLEAAPAMLRAGLTNESELRELAAEMARVANDDNVMVAQAKKVQVWARR
jgi:hypothetical protein